MFNKRNSNNFLTMGVRNVNRETSQSKILVDKIETPLLNPNNEVRKCEGGLRTHGIFKKSSFKSPLISIITVVYNGESFLKETIDSVINQTYKNIEYIVIDGGSSDNTIDIIRNYEHKIDYWISEKDFGIYDGMNKGLKLCRGKLIGLINADDWYELNAVEIIVSYFLRSDQKTVLHGNLNVVDKINKSYTVDKEFNLKLLKKGMVLHHPTVFVPKELYLEYGLFSTAYRVASDWDLMLRFYLNGVNFLWINFVLANFRLGGISFQINKISIVEKHNVRIKNDIVSIFDGYYLYDLLKLRVLGNYASRISRLKQQFFQRKL